MDKNRCLIGISLATTMGAASTDLIGEETRHNLEQKVTLTAKTLAYPGELRKLSGDDIVQPETLPEKVANLLGKKLKSDENGRFFIILSTPEKGVPKPEKIYLPDGKNNYANRLVKLIETSKLIVASKNIQKSTKINLPDR